MQAGKVGRILVVGDDMRIFLSIVRSFGRAGKRVEAFPYGDSPAMKSRYVAKLHAAPAYEVDRAAWNEALLTLLRTEIFDLVVPCSDPAIIFLDSVRGLLPRQRLAIPPSGAMTAFYDKQETHRLCEGLGICMAQSGLLKPTETAADLRRIYGLPLALKPRRTFFADKDQSREVVEIVDDESHLASLLAKIMDHSRYLVETYFAGDGVGLSVLAVDGEILVDFQHRRLREGRGGASSYRISEKSHPQLLEACREVMLYTRHTGVCMFEFRHNRTTGQWILIEINARFWGSMALPLSLGLDYPNMLYDVMVNGNRPAAISYVAGIRSRNFLLDGFNLVKQLRDLRPRNTIAWFAAVADFAMQPFRWIAGTEYSDTFVADDLRPAFWEFTLLLRKLGLDMGARRGAAIRNAS